MPGADRAIGTVAPATGRSSGWCPAPRDGAQRAWGPGRWPSGGVVGVDPHVLVAEVGEEDLGLEAVAGQADDVLDLLAADRLLERGEVVADGVTRRADLHALDRDVERDGRAAAQRRADRLRDAPPVRVGAVQRGLDQW